MSWAWASRSDSLDLLRWRVIVGPQTGHSVAGAPQVHSGRFSSASSSVPTASPSPTTRGWAPSNRSSSVDPLCPRDARNRRGRPMSHASIEERNTMQSPKELFRWLANVNRYLVAIPRRNPKLRTLLSPETIAMINRARGLLSRARRFYVPVDHQSRYTNVYH